MVEINTNRDQTDQYSRRHTQSSQAVPMLNLAERVSLLNRSSMDYIDPSELHFSQPGDDFPGLDMNSSRSSIQSSQSLGLATPSDLTLSNNPDSASSVSSNYSLQHEQFIPWPGRPYEPRATAVGRKSTKAALRVRPRNGQHARELERNRQAAANYRSRQKNQLDSLLTRVREEEDSMVKQKRMVCSLKEELWHLRNNLMARQQMQIFAMRNIEAGGATVPQKSLSLDPAPNLAERPMSSTKLGIVGL